MKLDIQFEELRRNVAAMGAKICEFDIGEVWSDEELIIDTQIGTQLGTTGIDIIDLDDVKVDEGLLIYKGRQVLLYIPEHNPKYTSIEVVITEPSKGNKYHVADCQALVKMRADNRYERYKVINNIEGIFPVYGNDYTGQLLEGHAELRVCQYCLSKLNYKGAQSNPRSRRGIARNFDLSEFFSKYSSFFKYYPMTHIRDAKKGYTADWDKISLRVRAASKFRCKECKVSLIDPNHKRLLHTHHRNGEKSDNRDGNLIPLCADCHRKEPYHDHLQVKHADVQLLNRLRREQGLLADNNWDKVIKYADPACLGVVLLCKELGDSVPQVAYKAVNEAGAEIAEFELAWPNEKKAVALHSTDPVAGWTVWGVHDAVEHFGKRLKKS